VPFGLLCQSVAVAWYALNADPAADIDRRRREAPWYSQKRDPSMLDVLAALRRELIQRNFVKERGGRPEDEKSSAPHGQWRGRLRRSRKSSWYQVTS
jgi:hypothetical protein